MLACPSRALYHSTDGPPTMTSNTQNRSPRGSPPGRPPRHSAQHHLGTFTCTEEFLMVWLPRWKASTLRWGTDCVFFL